MDKNATFNINMQFLDKVSAAEVGEDSNNPLLSWVKLVFADDKPNANKQGIKQDEFDNLAKSMVHMPIKAKYNEESGLEGHRDANIIGVIKSGVQEDNKLIAVGALYKDEVPDIINYFKEEVENGGQVDFSWEIRYTDSELDDDGVEWLQGTITKAITAVSNPAYGGRTPLLSISSANQLIKLIDAELVARAEAEND